MDAADAHAHAPLLVRVTPDAAAAANSAAPAQPQNCCGRAWRKIACGVMIAYMLVLLFGGWGPVVLYNHARARAIFGNETSTACAHYGAAECAQQCDCGLCVSRSNASEPRCLPALYYDPRAASPRCMAEDGGDDEWRGPRDFCGGYDGFPSFIFGIYATCAVGMALAAILGLGACLARFKPSVHEPISV